MLSPTESLPSNARDVLVEVALQRCAAEPIHRPGAIQPHGCLLAADDGLTVCHASINLAEFLGLDPDAALGMPLARLLGEAGAGRIAALLASQASGTVRTLRLEVPTGQGLRLFGAQAHRNGGLLFVELEPVAELDQQALFETRFLPVRDRLWALEQSSDLAAYMAEVTRQVAQFTGIDRVMVYRFDSQWDGEVIAETLNTPVESFLGHHFPAADIPAQARDLYLKNRLRLIADVGARPVPIVPPIHAATGEPLDLSYSGLRSFSPVHLDYLRNMGVCASLTFSLVSQGRLWGLIACHHYQPFRLEPHVRELADFVGRAVSIRISEIEEAERQKVKREAEQALASLPPMGPGDAFSPETSRRLLPIVGASGAVVCVNQRKYFLGQVPDVAFLGNLRDWLESRAQGSLYVTDALPDAFPPAARCAGLANGLLVTGLGEGLDNSVMWFRPEVIRTVKWAGNPEKILEASADGVRLSPRKSFAAWVQSYGGHSIRWTHADIDIAQRLGHALIRRIAERHLEAASQRHADHEALLEDDTRLVVELGPDTRYRRVSANSSVLLGFAARELPGHPLADFAFVDDRDGLERHFARLRSAIDPQAVPPFAFRHSRKDGSYLWLEISPHGPLSSGAGTVFVLRDISERQRYNEALENLHRLHQRALSAQSTGVVTLDARRHVLAANEAAHQLLGHAPGQLRGLHYCRALCQMRACANRAAEACGAPLVAHPHTQAIECHSGSLRRHDGPPLPVQMWVLPFAGDPGRDPAEVVVFRALSGLDPERQGREIGVFITDRQGVIHAVNEGFSRITGYRPDDVLGRTPALLRSNAHSRAFYRQFWQTLTHQRQWHGEFWNRRRNGETYPQLTTIFALTGADGEVLNYLALFEDNGTQSQSAEKAHTLPQHDALTGIPARGLIEQAIAGRIEGGSAAPFAVVFLDLDNFTAVNDALGHITGDRLLYQIAARLSAQMRPGDLLGRWSGDTFVAILDGLGEERAATQGVLRLAGALSRAFPIAGQELTVSARCGVALHPRDGDEARALLVAADTALTQARHHERRQICFYTPELGERSRQRLALVTELRAALRRREFFLVFQPQVDAGSGRVVGLEALVRWRHPERGVVLPAEFIPVAEAEQLIVDLGDEVLQLACAQIRAWRDAFGFAVPVGINVAPAQLVPGYPEHLEAVLRAHGVPPALIEIEITESALVPTPAVRSVVRGIKELGVSLAIDDFGTGYSSLSHLKLFPFDRLKIDKSFVDGLPDNPDDIAIGQAIIALGSALRVNVLAEGVERETQAAFLRGEGVSTIQGYLFSRPLDAERIPELLAAAGGHHAS